MCRREAAVAWWKSFMWCVCSALHKALPAVWTPARVTIETHWGRGAEKTGRGSWLGASGRALWLVPGKSGVTWSRGAFKKRKDERDADDFSVENHLLKSLFASSCCQSVCICEFKHATGFKWPYIVCWCHCDHTQASKVGEKTKKNYWGKRRILTIRK